MMSQLVNSLQSRVFSNIDKGIDCQLLEPKQKYEIIFKWIFKREIQRMAHGLFSLLKMQFESLSAKVLSGSHFVLVSACQGTSSDYDVSQRLNPFPNTTFGCKDI